MSLGTEIKRKLFHHLSLVYLLIYAILPRWLSLIIMTLSVGVVGSIEFLRLRRPEVNARLLARFGGIHRVSEIMAPSGVFWTLIGCWLVMVIFIDRILGITAIGFLVFGDTAAALVGQVWGKRHWKRSPRKTIEGTLAFAIVSILWGLLFVRARGAIAGGVLTAYLESIPLPINDNLWIPAGGAAAIAVCFGGRLIHGNLLLYVVPRLGLYCVVFFSALFLLQKYQAKRFPALELDEGDLHA